MFVPSVDDFTLRRQFIMDWLNTDSDKNLQQLWTAADTVCRESVGSDVHLRGLIEISNDCDRLCCYCGIRSANRSVDRYSMAADEILESAHEAMRLGYGTVVLQAGEKHKIDSGFMVDIIRHIKSETNLAISLSLGEYGRETLHAWINAGADRYFMRFETSNFHLYRKLHPDSKGGIKNRQATLRLCKELGFETGSGVMVGLPGQSKEDLCEDLLMFGALDLSMIGMGPFILHNETPIGKHPAAFGLNPNDQSINRELLTYKMVALTRLLYPSTNLPATTALTTMNPDGAILALQRGANVIMPNLTPMKYRADYEIYPGKTRGPKPVDAQHELVKSQIKAADKTIGTGPGSSLHFLEINAILHKESA